MNVLALLILAFVVDGALRPATWFATALASALAIDAGLYFIDDRVDWYVGLSGVLHGLLGAASLELWLRGRMMGALLLAALIGKIAWEQWAGPVPLTQHTAGGPVIVSAHLFGACAGTLWLGVSRSIHALRARPL
jgi:rhomboid family GlyGly-CTERM serine protease